MPIHAQRDAPIPVLDEAPAPTGAHVVGGPQSATRLPIDLGMLYRVGPHIGDQMRSPALAPMTGLIGPLTRTNMVGFVLTGVVR